MPVVIEENVIPKHGKRAAYVSLPPFISPKGTIGYIPIPKVGTSTVSRVLSHERDWGRKNIPDNCTMFALIRHPFDRWISGTTEHWNPILTRGDNDLTPLINISFEQLLKESFEDRHTQPQAWNLDLYFDVKLFKFETLYKLWDWLEYKDSKVHERNHLTMKGLQKNIWKIVSEKAKYKPIIKLYEEDMQLWKSAI